MLPLQVMGPVKVTQLDAGIHCTPGVPGLQRHRCKSAALKDCQACTTCSASRNFLPHCDTGCQAQEFTPLLGRPEGKCSPAEGTLLWWTRAP